MAGVLLCTILFCGVAGALGWCLGQMWEAVTGVGVVVLVRGLATELGYTHARKCGPKPNRVDL